MLAISALGMLIAGGFVGLQLSQRFVVVGYGSALIIGLGIVSLGVFVRSLWQLLSGHTQGSVD
jgi:hypothetical protein